MPDVNLPIPTPGLNDKDTIQNLIDVVYKMRKELDFLLQNLDESNVLRAQVARIAEIYAGTIEANKITTVEAKIQDAQIDNLSADKISAGTIDLSDSISVKNTDSSVKMDANGIDITNGKISIKNLGGASTIIDGYGIDPKFLDYFKNMVYNSSFEGFDSVSLCPFYWFGGTSDANSNFHGSYSMKVLAGNTATQLLTAAINPAWYGRGRTRVTFFSKGGQVKIQVYDVTNSRYFTLTDEAGNTGTYITYPTRTNWQDSRSSVSFDSDQSGGSSCTQFLIVFTNVHGSDAAYIDAVSCHPDFTGKWAQLYKDGPKSTPAFGSADAVIPVNPIQVETNSAQKTPTTGSETSIVSKTFTLTDISKVAIWFSAEISADGAMNMTATTYVNGIAKTYKPTHYIAGANNSLFTFSDYEEGLPSGSTTVEVKMESDANIGTIAVGHATLIILPCLDDVLPPTITDSENVEP